jgi:hypothetical protein
VIELVSGRQIRIGKDSEILFSRKLPELVIAFYRRRTTARVRGSAIAAVIEG